MQKDLNEDPPDRATAQHALPRFRWRIAARPEQRARRRAEVVFVDWALI